MTMDTLNVGSTDVSVQDMVWEGITLTKSAAARIIELSRNKHYFYLNIKVSGCTGFAYDIKLIEQPATDDLIFESNNATFYVALNAMPMIDGTEIDFVREGLNQSFTYRNPKVKHQCGCGESFGV